MGDVFIYVHGGGDTAVRHIFVVIGAGLTVHSVHTWHRNFLITSRYIPEYRQMKDKQSTTLNKQTSENLPNVVIESGKVGK